MYLVGILFPHINDDARSKSNQIILCLPYTINLSVPRLQQVNINIRNSCWLCSAIKNCLAAQCLNRHWHILNKWHVPSTIRTSLLHLRRHPSMHYRISRPIRRNVIISLEILEKKIWCIYFNFSNLLEENTIVTYQN